MAWKWETEERKKDKWGGGWWHRKGLGKLFIMQGRLRGMMKIKLMTIEYLALCLSCSLAFFMPAIYTFKRKYLDDFSSLQALKCCNCTTGSGNGLRHQDAVLSCIFHVHEDASLFYNMISFGDLGELKLIKRIHTFQVSMTSSPYFFILEGLRCIIIYFHN